MDNDQFNVIGMFMPKPFIILQQYLGTGAPNFISEHAHELKSLGYSKFLWEMNSDVSYKQLKQQLLSLLRLLDPESLMHKSHKATLAMLSALEKNGITCEFIDPETQAEAIIPMHKLENAYLSGSITKIQKATNDILDNTKKRDQKMLPIILQEAASHQGGIIYLGGFMHTHLVQELAKSTCDYRFAMFADSREEYNEPGTLNPDAAQWVKLYDAETRRDFYQTNVCFFNMASDRHLSFEMMEAVCKLTEQRALTEEELPQVARDFERLMPGYQYLVDEHHVVTASKSYPHPQAAKASLVGAKIGIRFFMTKDHDGVTRVDAPGINLKENSTIIKAL